MEIVIDSLLRRIDMLNDYIILRKEQMELENTNIYEADIKNWKKEIDQLNKAINILKKV